MTEKETDFTPLCEASNDQLFDELERRFDHACFAGIIDNGNKVGTDRHRWAIGNAHTSAGLAADAQKFLLDRLQGRIDGEVEDD